MTTIIFVHGTGVREDAYKASFEVVERNCKGVSVSNCYWGHLGSRLNKNGASIPDYDTARAVSGEGMDPAATDEDYGIALWGLLYDDPLYELRVLALRQKMTGELAPGQTPPGAELREYVKRFQIAPELQTLLEKGGIDKEFEAARATITGSELYRAALTGAPAGLADYRAAIARALIAEAAALTSRAAQETMDLAGASDIEVAEPAVFSDAALRDKIEQLLIQELGGGEYGIGGWLKQQLGGFVLTLGSRYVRRRRGAITDATYPGTGDILLYQARGCEIREFIQQRIAAAPRPRVVLAHSLGGIACVDLLVSKDCELDLLVTVGSQAPFLYEINALQSLPFGNSLPEHFPRWVNLYDLRDFLSYLGEPVFPGRVTDVKVDNRQRFPEAHSAYWSNPVVWEVLAKELP
jgi:hypothetical protein